MEAMRRAWATSTFWFDDKKKGKGWLVDFAAFRNAFPAIRKQYEHYREAVEHKDDPAWQARRAIDKEMESEQRAFDAKPEMEIPYR